ncbi:MAG TPA: biliverdin-producing heme oxygenase [Myxococcaceae bacterium]
MIDPLVGAMLRCSMCGVCGRYLACAAYAKLLRAWHHVYGALESALDAAGLQLSELQRRSDLELDIASLAGRSWMETTPPSEAACAYADHLTRLAETEPELLAAHVVVRYRGDVLGGLRRGAVIADVLGLPVPEGIRFFTGGSGSVARLASALRTIERPIENGRAADEVQVALAAERQLYGEACAGLQ